MSNSTINGNTIITTDMQVIDNSDIIGNVELTGNTNVSNINIVGNTTVSTVKDATPLELEPEQSVSFLKPLNSFSFSDIFTKSNIITLLWFLAIYLVVYFVLGIFYSSNPEKNSRLIASRVFDLMVLLFVLGTFVYYFFSLSDAEKKAELDIYLSELKDYLDKPSSMISLLLFIFVLYAVIFIVGLPMTSATKPVSISIIEGIVWILFSISLIGNFFKYTFGMNILDSFHQFVSNLINKIPDGSVTSGGAENGTSSDIVNPVSEETPPADITYAPTDEVFNIAQNLYTYSDANAICKSYGARLATYDEIEQAYNDGAEWCNYGWSEGQSVYFPTQKKTWEVLQQDPKKKGLCGRPGVNGGYVKNPELMVGVNCYGKKPIATDKDLAYMSANRGQIGPKTPEDKELDAKVDFWKKNSHTLIRINGFNNDKWSSY
jgi:hypothetical protein